MFDVKVKTLDGLTQQFSVPDDATVIQFKDIIREKTEIAVDRQRLLFQGRVLQDDLLLSSYGVAGNVMHLVTRLPPQSRTATSEPPTTEREGNSDINRDQIRNILSDVFNNIGDLNNPVGMSVNNEGSRMDITVNVPIQNRLSLSRLRQNYVWRLLNQARNVLNYMEDPSSTAVPRCDRERLRQVDPYDIGPNEERMIEVTSQPLPISNLADMVGLARLLWRDAESQFDLWESVLRREAPPVIATERSESEMQRIHDSASRYIHLFAHILHILSDYLVEFQPVTRSTAAPRPTVSPTVSSTAADISDSAPEPSDNSRYLYVFSEMPTQMVQVRLDVDATIRNIRSTAPTAPTAPTNVQTSAAAAERPSENVAESPVSGTHVTNEPPISGQRRAPTSRGQPQHDNTAPSATTSRTLRSAPLFVDNVDPYVRCQSRHFQHLPNMRSGAVFSTFGGIRIVDGSHANPRGTTATTAENTTTTNMTTSVPNGGQVNTDNDHLRALINGLMNSIFPAVGINTVPRSTVTSASTTVQTQQPPPQQPVSFILNPIGSENVTVVNNQTQPANDLQRILHSLTHTGGSNLNAPLSQIFPEMLINQDLDGDNFVTNKIIQIVISRLTLIDFLGVARGQYTSLNQLRVPLQEILSNHQREVGSRDALVEHVVSDLELFNRAYTTVFERLRSGSPFNNLSEEARNSFNIRLDISQTLNNLNRHHFQSMIDMIMRSPTNQGFGQLLMNSLKLHHDETLALIDIICNNNEELRRFLLKSFLDSLVLSMSPSTDGSPININLGLDMLLGDLNTGIFRRPEQLTELKEHTMNNFVVYLDVIEEATNSGEGLVNGHTNSIEDMITNLTENITNGTTMTEVDNNSLVQCTTAVLSDFMETCGVEEQQNDSPWQAVLPQEWLQIMTHDSAISLDDNVSQTPFSDAYVSGMPPKRRKVILSQRQLVVQPSSDMMIDCLEQAVRSLTGESAVTVPVLDVRSLPNSLTNSFQEMVTERLNLRLTNESLNFSSERFPAAEHNFNRRKRFEDKKNN